VREAYRNGAALLAAVAIGYGLASDAQLPAPESAGETDWSLPEPDAPDLAAARQRLDELTPWKSQHAQSEAGSGDEGARDDGAAQDNTGDASSWAFHGVVEPGGRPVALIATGDGEIRRIPADAELPSGERITAIHADWLQVSGPDGQRRIRLYQPQ